MNALIRFILILALVFAIAFFALRPSLLEDVWLWLVGFMGVIYKLFSTLWNKIKPGAKEEQKNKILSDRLAELELRYQNEYSVNNTNKPLEINEQ